MDASPVAELGVEVDDDLLLGVREEAPLEVGAEVVCPAQAAALAAPRQPGQLGHGAPAAMAVCEDEVDELAVLLRRPRSPLHPELVAARLPPHPDPSQRPMTVRARAGPATRELEQQRAPVKKAAAGERGPATNPTRAARPGQDGLTKHQRKMGVASASQPQQEREGRNARGPAVYIVP
jgi:hypothetical protein